MKLFKVRTVAKKDEEAVDFLKIAPKQEWQAALGGWKDKTVRKDWISGGDSMRRIQIGGFNFRYDGLIYKSNDQYTGKEAEIKFQLCPLKKGGESAELVKKLLPSFPSGTKILFGDIIYTERIDFDSPQQLRPLAAKALQKWGEFVKIIDSLPRKF